MLGAILLMSAAGTPAANCRAAAHDLPANAVISAADLIAVPCRAGAPRAPLRYDRAGGVLVAASALPVGTYLGAIAPLADRAIAKGSALILRSSAGPVVIERTVTAMQSGHAGGRLFVRDADGRVFAVPLAVVR